MRPTVRRLRDAAAGTVLPLLAILALAAGFGTIVRGGGEPRPDSTAALGELADPASVFDPVAAGEALPAGFRQVLPRDAILPIYDPTFVPPDMVRWADDALVIGVAMDGEAKAYPVSYLNRREMVIDRIAGIPILVTW